MRSTYVIFAENLELRKSAIAMWIFIETSDHRDFRDLDRQLGIVYYILRLGPDGSCGRGKFASKNCINFLALCDECNQDVDMRESVQERMMNRLVSGLTRIR